MARQKFGGFELVSKQLAQLDRGTTRRLVEAGVAALVEETRKAIENNHHIVTGSMKAGIAPTRYHETLEGGWIDVYPQGEDAKGVSNARKAYIINYGRNKKRSAKMGDKFLTGSASRRKRQNAVELAMQKENEKILKEIGGN